MPVLDHGPDFGPGITAFTTDAEVDFLQQDPLRKGPSGLMPSQRDVLAAAGVTGGLVFPRQVHGDVIWEVGPDDLGRSGQVEADAVITLTPGLAIGVRTADCLPLLLWAPDQRVVAAVHAGWKSTRLDIARKTVDLLIKKFRVDPAVLRAVIGPCIRPASYPVGPEFRELFPRDILDRDGCLFLDVPGANKRQLAEAGVREAHIVDRGRDCYADLSCHSFRRDGDRAGRMLSAIMMSS